MKRNKKGVLMMSVLGNGGIGSIKKQIFLLLGLFFSSSHLGAVTCPQTVGAMSINEGIWNVLTRIGKAADVIESQICGLGGLGSGCSFSFGQTDVGAGNIYTISVPGVYCMSEDITFSFGTAITIASSDVTINMEGHTLNGANNPLAVVGIELQNYISNVTIENGTIENISGDGFYAIRASGSPASMFNAALVNITINGVNFNNNWGAIGLGLGGSAGEFFLDGIMIENCNFFGTLQGDINIVSIASIVRNCQLQNFFELLAPDVAAGTFYALVEDCVVSSTSSLQAGSIMVEADNVVVRNCIVQGPTNQGIQVNGNAVTISDCTIQGGDTSAATNGLSLVSGPAANASVALIERCVVADSCGFNIEFAGNSLKFVDCVAQNSAFDGFNILTGRSIIFERCAAQGSANNGFVAQIYGIGGLGGSEDIIFNDCQAEGNSVCGFLLVTPSGSLASLASAAFNQCVAESNSGDGFSLDNITGKAFENISFNDCVAQNNGSGASYGTSIYLSDGFGVNSATNAMRAANSTINNVVFTNCIAQYNFNNGFNFGAAAYKVDTISCQYCTAQQNGARIGSAHPANGMNFSSTSTNCEVYMCLLAENGFSGVGNGINNLNPSFGPLPSSANSFLANRSFNNAGVDYFQINDGTNGQPFFSKSTEALVQGASPWANMST